MGQNVLTKQSASRLVSAHVWTSLMIFIANSRTNLAHAQTVDTRPFSFPPPKGTGYEANRTHDRTPLFHREWHVIQRMRRQCVPGPVFHRLGPGNEATTDSYFLLHSNIFCFARRRGHIPLPHPPPWASLRRRCHPDPPPNFFSVSALRPVLPWLHMYWGS